MKSVIKRNLKSKKGFTLIEVVVVLVILAILAGIAVPALTGYIEDAKERTAIVEARNILVGLQHMATTDGIDNGDNRVEGERSNGYFAYVMPGSYSLESGCDLSSKGVAKMVELLGIEKAKVSHPNEEGNKKTQGLDGIFVKDGKIHKFFYISKGFKVTYNEGKYVTENILSNSY